MYFCSPGATNQQNKGLCNVLVSELCHGSVSRVEMDSAPGCSLPSFQIQGAPGLTGLIQGLGQVCAPFSRIAYLNVSTLKELIIRPTTDAEWRTVIYGDSKTPAVYTSLTLITLVTEDVPLGVKWTAIKGVTPFPVLIHLGIVGAYPFDDDNSLYRGNGRSLKCLHLPFGVVSRNILGKYSILNRSGVAQMDTIVFGRVIDMDNNPVAGRANAIIKQQVDRMLEVTRQLSLANDTADMQVFNAIKTAPRTAIIQHLSFSILPLDIDMLFDIVSALPSLITLACRLKKSVPSVKSLPLNKQPNILHGRYYPLSSNFKRLDIVDDENISAKKAAAVAMQLAVICPSFAFVDVPRDIRKVIRREIAWAMVNQPFKPYADALRRLI
ncbi:hypothetical protein FBU31_002253 [Coemansia sp. 'formosensis']|nr:hypothetical protein FBU31_002253 [Coemansia sp. 'formosensis']